MTTNIDTRDADRPENPDVIMARRLKEAADALNAIVYEAYRMGLSVGIETHFIYTVERSEGRPRVEPVVTRRIKP